MNVLLLSYHFPPMGGAGVQRALKFSKYLGDFGVHTTVLSGSDPGYLQDPALASEIPGDVPVVRVPHQPLLQRALAWRARGRAGPVAGGPAAASRTPAAAGGHDPRLRDAVLRTYASLHFPDDKAGWARRARAPALALLRERGIDLILSTAPPMSAHALAARLARQARLPWVADYRDLWTENPAYDLPAWRRALDRRAEAGWLQHAAGVVTVTPSWQRMLADRLGPGRDVAFIPNGYDETDFARPSTPRLDDGLFRIVHTGALYAHQSPHALLAGAEVLLARDPALARRLRLQLVGQIGTRFLAMLDAFAARHPGVLERAGFVEHSRAVDAMRAADLLLLVVGGGTAARGVLPGKIFEYLRSGGPVLLIGPTDGDAARLLRTHARCQVVDEGDVAGIAAALAAALEGSLPQLPVGADPARFERRALAGELAQFLRRCHAAGPR